VIIVVLSAVVVESDILALLAPEAILPAHIAHPGEVLAL
jgi:hypothetical protein